MEVIGTWNMDHGPSPPNIFNLVIEVIDDFMTPHGIYSIKIFVSLGACFHDPSTHLQHENFCITLSRFLARIGLDLTSI